MSLSHTQAREILRQAWRSVWGREPTDNEVTYAAAIAYLETGYGRAGQFGALASQGVYNWGALERRASADGTCPTGTVPGSDQGSVCFYAFPSDVAAASAFIKTLTQKHWPVIQAMKGSPLDVATAMRVPPPYYTGTSGSDEDRAQAYANAITNAIRAAGQSVPSGSSAFDSRKTLALLVLGASAVALGYHAYQTNPKFRRLLA